MSDVDSRARSFARENGVEFEELVAIYVLDGVRQFGPMKFHSVREAGRSCAEIIQRPELLPGKGKRIEQLKIAIAEHSERLFDEKSALATKQLYEADKHQAKILTYSHPDYPTNVYRSNNPIPILYARGNTSILTQERAIACVGSRKIREPYSRLHKSFVAQACEENFVIVSGFALGADTLGHQSAYEVGGATVCVMPGGLQRMFPPENKHLWDDLLGYKRAVFLTEFGFGSRASALNLRKRNKLIVACALGVLISQSAAKGGAMNAFRFAMEQKKRIATFESEADSNREPEDATSGNEEIRKSEKAMARVFSSQSPIEMDYAQWLSTLS